MELHGETRAFGQRGGEIDAVVPVPHHLARIAGLDVVAVHEVEARLVGNLVPQRVLHRLAHLVPAHVRHLQVLAGFVQVLAEEAHLAGEQTDAVDPSFSSLRSSNACMPTQMPRNGRSWLTLADQGVEAQAADLGHAVADRANPGTTRSASRITAASLLAFPCCSGRQPPVQVAQYQSISYDLLVGSIYPASAHQPRWRIRGVKESHTRLAAAGRQPPTLVGLARG